MKNITITLSKKLKNKMNTMPNVDWNAIANNAFEQKLSEIELLKQENSEKTEDLSDLLAWIEKLPKTKGKKTRLSQNIDKILYGVSRKGK